MPEDTETFPVPAPDTSRIGIIYLLENEAFATQVIKIGRTGSRGQDLAARIRTLNTGVPLPFRCYRASLVQDAVEVERQLHQVFYPAKQSWRGEFYEVEPWRVELVLRLHEIEDMTAHAPALSKEEVDDINAAELVREKREKFSFAEVEVPVGTKLTLTNSDIQCEVADARTGVLYDGQQYSLSGLAKQLKGYPYSVNGILHWEYDNETLQKRRERMQESESAI